jgi:hypothetical protein
LARPLSCQAQWVLPLADGKRCVVVCDRDPLPEGLATGSGRMSFGSFNKETEALASEAAARAAAEAAGAAAGRAREGGITVTDEQMAARLAPHAKTEARGGRASGDGGDANTGGGGDWPAALRQQKRRKLRE